MGGSDSEVEKTAQKDTERKKLLAVAPIAKPLAGKKKLSKRTFKLDRRGIHNHYFTLFVMLCNRHSSVFSYGT